MAGGYANQPRGVEGVAAELRRLQREIDRLRREVANFGLKVDGATGDLVFDSDTGALQIDSGSGLLVNAANGNTVLASGKFSGLAKLDGSPQSGTMLLRDTGEPALAIIDLNPADGYQQSLQMFDRAGNIILADDTNSGKGLAAPYLPLGPLEDVVSWPTANTTSGSYSELLRGFVYRHHPRIYVQLMVVTDTGTTGSVRLRITGGAVIGSAVSVAAGSTTVVDFGGAMLLPTPAGYPQALNLSVEARTAVGTGRIGARCIGAWGLQS